MLTVQEQEVLELLRAIPPLLPPDLTCSPPSSPRPDRNGSDPSSRQKRSRSESNGAGNGRVVGLGISVSGADDNASGAKRSRPPPPPPPANRTQPPPATSTEAATAETVNHARASPRSSHSTLAHASNATRSSPRVDPSAKYARIEAEWRQQWPKERLRKVAAQCREHGRKLKHAGDALSRASSGSSGRKNTLLAMAHHIDSILLYVFSFWCDDTANKNCNVQQWASVYGLVAFVKKQAQHENVPVVLGLCYRMEAIAVFTTSMHEQKALHHKATQLLGTASLTSAPNQTPRMPPPPPLPSGPPPPPPPRPPPPPAASATAGSPASLSASTNSSHPASPAPAVAAASSSSAATQPSPSALAATLPSSSSSTKATDEFLRSFVKASPELFRFQRLYDTSCSTLSPSLLATFYPRTWHLSTHAASPDTLQPATFVLPNKPWKFAWPAELGRGTLGHQIAWARALVEEWAEAEGLDYTIDNVGEQL